MILYSQPSRKKSKAKNPHSIAAAVAANRAAEKKTLTLNAIEI